MVNIQTVYVDENPIARWIVGGTLFAKGMVNTQDMENKEGISSMRRRKALIVECIFIAFPNKNFTVR